MRLNLYQIYDISPPLSPETAVWPGDTPFRKSVQTRLEDGASVALASFETTCHIGAHADAPAHYAAGRPTIDEVGLAAYLGPCVVLEVITGSGISPQQAQAAIDQRAERVLFKTRLQQDHRVFAESFAYFEPETVGLLGRAGVKLLGIDTPSVDPFHSKNLPAHQALLEHGMRNLEGLDLSAVPAGVYELIALPLRLKGFDGSPVRAVLRTL